ncbi:MAG: hypothetical protein AAF744_08350 [Pseudomonadota bacterium]
MKYVFAALLLLTGPAFADAPVIKNVSMKKSGETWSFDVTLMHGDTGWEDYADGWRVLDMNGKELGVRVLAHPHVNEQPFTRSLSGVKIPADVTEVGIQASDSVGGWSSPVKTIRLR